MLITQGRNLMFSFLNGKMCNAYQKLSCRLLFIKLYFCFSLINITIQTYHIKLNGIAHFNNEYCIPYLTLIECKRMCSKNSADFFIIQFQLVLHKNLNDFVATYRFCIKLSACSDIYSIIMVMRFVYSQKANIVKQFNITRKQLSKMNGILMIIYTIKNFALKNELYDFDFYTETFFFF